MAAGQVAREAVEGAEWTTEKKEEVGWTRNRIHWLC